MSDPTQPGDEPTDGQPPTPPPPPPPPPGGTTPPGSPPPPPPPPGTPAPAAGGYQQYSTGPQAAPAGSDVSQAFQYAWTKFQQNFGQIIIAIAVWLGAAIVLGIIGFVLTAVLVGDGGVECTETAFGEVCTASGASLWRTLLTSAIWSLFWFAAYTIGSFLIIRAALAITAGRPLTKDELMNFDNFVPFLITGLVVAVITAIGFMACVVPGLIAYFFLFFATYYAVDQGMPVGEALRASVTLMNQNLARMVVFFIAAWIAQLIGALLCGVGLLVAIPVVIIASAYMYRTANGEAIAA